MHVVSPIMPQKSKICLDEQKWLLPQSEQTASSVHAAIRLPQSTAGPCRVNIKGYVARRLLTDEAFRTDLLSRIAKVGAAVEEALGSAQDIEGCVEADGSITVVQTRPQF